MEEWNQNWEGEIILDCVCCIEVHLQFWYQQLFRNVVQWEFDSRSLPPFFGYPFFRGFVRIVAVLHVTGVVRCIVLTMVHGRLNPICHCTLVFVLVITDSIVSRVAVVVIIQSIPYGMDGTIDKRMISASWL
jgi:hypothetical protein